MTNRWTMDDFDLDSIPQPYIPIEICVVCTGEMYWQDCPTGGWYIHKVHPDDNHDARLYPDDGKCQGCEGCYDCDGEGYDERVSIATEKADESGIWVVPEQWRFPRDLGR